MPKPQQLFITAKDIQHLSGKEERAARTMLANIKRYFNKKAYQAITIGELCEFLNINRDEVEELADSN